MMHQGRNALQLRLLILDPQSLMFDELRAVLEAMPDLVVVAETAHKATAQGLYTTRAPDIVLVLTDWVDGAILDTIQGISQQASQIPITVLSIRPTELRVAAAFAAGARGYMHRDGLQELPLVVRLVAQGGIACCSVSANELARRIVQSQALSPRERVIAAQIAAGQTNAEIASTLRLKITTVDTHVERILRKVQGRTRVDIATWWLQHIGLSTDDAQREVNGG
jgi:DNA-binding NarL/FixJ family response regulator